MYELQLVLIIAIRIQYEQVNDGAVTEVETSYELCNQQVILL
jgi:hypothetical protein